VRILRNGGCRQEGEDGDHAHQSGHATHQEHLTTDVVDLRGTTVTMDSACHNHHIGVQAGPP
jgi:hypothetical protein